MARLTDWEQRACHLCEARPYLMNSQILPDIFIAIYLLFAVFWDSPGSNLIERRLKSILRPFITGMGLSYRWNMYSGPFTDIIELEARARYADGTTAVISLRLLATSFGAIASCWFASNATISTGLSRDTLSRGWHSRIATLWPSRWSDVQPRRLCGSVVWGDVSTLSRLQNSGSSSSSPGF